MHKFLFTLRWKFRIPQISNNFDFENNFNRILLIISMFQLVSSDLFRERKKLSFFERENGGEGGEGVVKSPEERGGPRRRGKPLGTSPRFHRPFSDLPPRLLSPDLVLHQGKSPPGILRST